MSERVPLLEQKVAIVTGVSHAGQVGPALSLALIRQGARVAISSRSAERVQARTRELLAAQAGAEVIGVAADLTDEAGASRLVAETIATFGHVDILVNLAGGLTTYGPSAELSLAAWEAELNNNLRTTFLCTRAVWPFMQKQGGGKILNFSRAGGVQSAGAYMAAYNAAKAGVDALTLTFAQEGKDAGIYVNALGPGLIVTQSNLDALHPSPAEQALTWVPMEQIIEAALFLVSASSDGVTGALLPVRGRGI
ncbi:MAG TPA: SDR family NAD(P)-dependent oxidoreductase [Ktedonobacteraceae bacterium]|jgi:NAD(P)-dependent dehydrogenase (short-subunit alcohol dehydrogenase family)